MNHGILKSPEPENGEDYEGKYQGKLINHNNKSTEQVKQRQERIKPERQSDNRILEPTTNIISSDMLS